MTLKTRTKFTSQLQGIQEHVVRLKEKCAADVRAAGLAATGDRGAQEGVVEGRKAEDRLRESIEDGCLDAMLLQQPLIGDDLRFVSGAFRIVSDLSHIDGMTRDVAFLVEEIPDKAAAKFTREFVEMSEHAASMVERAVDAFVERDVELAQRVIEADHKVNCFMPSRRRSSSPSSATASPLPSTSPSCSWSPSTSSASETSPSAWPPGPYSASPASTGLRRSPARPRGSTSREA